MMNRTLPLTLLALLLALAAPLFSQGKGDGSKLSELMGDIQKTTKHLAGVLEEDEPDWDAALAEVCRLQKVAIDAKNEVPGLVSAIEEEKKQAKARLEYRAKMQDFVRGLLEVETALLEQKAKAAKKALRGLDKLKSDGHGKFKREW